MVHSHVQAIEGIQLLAEYSSVYLEMPVAFMENSDRGSPFSQSDSQSPQDWVG